MLAQYFQEHFGQHILPDKLMDENVAAFRIKPAYVLETIAKVLTGRERGSVSNTPSLPAV